MPLTLNMAEPLLADIVAWWHRYMDDGTAGTWVDLVSSRVGLLAAGAAKVATTHTGGMGSVQCHANDAPEYVEVTAHASLAPDAGTIGHWLRINSDNDGGGIYGFTNAGLTLGYGAQFNLSDEYEAFVQGSGNVVAAALGALDTWAYWMVTWNGTDTITLYKNGTSVDSAAYGGTLTAGDELAIGVTHVDLGPIQIVGHHDDWMLWSRALNATEAGDVYLAALAAWDGFFMEEGGGGMGDHLVWRPHWRPRRFRN